MTDQPELWRTDPRERLLAAIDRTWAYGTLGATPTDLVDDFARHVATNDNEARRLRLAHQARRAKEHQLDDIRRALCDIGAMDDDDPYSLADLADVIRRMGGAVAADGLNGPAAVSGTPACGSAMPHPAHRYMLGRKVGECRGVTASSDDVQPECALPTFMECGCNHITGCQQPTARSSTHARGSIAPPAPCCAHCPHPKADHTAAGALGRKALCNSCQPPDWSHAYEAGDGADGGSQEQYAAVIADRLRQGAYHCDGDCGKTERDCTAEHPVQVSCWTRGAVSDVEGPIDAIAALLVPAVAAVRDAEVQQLRADLAVETAFRKERSDLYDPWRAKANEQGAAIDRVRAQHTRVAVNDECYECSQRDSPDYSVPWPCPTIAALDGPADTTPETAP